MSFSSWEWWTRFLTSWRKCSVSLGKNCFVKQKTIFDVLTLYKKNITLSFGEIELSVLKKSKFQFQKNRTLTCKTNIQVTCFMKTWKDPIVITEILLQTISAKPMMEVWFLANVLTVICFDRHLHLKNRTNEFGYKISASGLRYHLWLVARVCLLPFSAHTISKLYQNWLTLCVPRW